MKFKTMIRRIAQKTGSVDLMRVLAEQAPVESLSNECIVWTGKKTMEGLYTTTRRDSNNIPVLYQARRRPMGVIQVDGKSEYLHRLVHRIVFKPLVEFHLTNKCGNTLCCHPLHWKISGSHPEFEAPGQEWSYEDALEAVEAMIGRYSIYSWEDVITNPLMQDVPEDLIRKCLQDLNKEHLL